MVRGAHFLRPQIHPGNGQSNADDLHGFYFLAISTSKWFDGLTCASHLRKLMKSWSRVCNFWSGVRHWTDVLANNSTRGRGMGPDRVTQMMPCGHQSLPEIRNR